MSGSSKIRVACAQFAVGDDIDSNLKACLRAIEQASHHQPDLLVLPEFSNHLSWYRDQAHCYEVSVTTDGEFLTAISEAARRAAFYLVINCTMRRADGRCTGTSLLYSPAGELLASNDKQVLMGHENDFLVASEQEGPLTELPFGRVGLYSCMDGVINETTRGLALRGAQLLCNSLNSFAPDEAGLHIPVRAAENKVFVAAANKVGPLIPESMLEDVSAATNIPMRFLMGAGESQVVAPDGSVLAMASADREEVIYADVDLETARDKRRPDGTDIFASRRPRLYAPIGEDPKSQLLSIHGSVDMEAGLLNAGSCGPAVLGTLAEQLQVGFAGEVELLALPALFFLDAVDDIDLAAATEASTSVLRLIAENCPAKAMLATTLVRGDADQGFRHVAVLVGSDGVLLEQQPLHEGRRFAWSSTADEISVFDTDSGRIAVLHGDDAIYPETFRLAALAGVNIAVVPVAAQERWELATGLVERAAENRINLLCPTRDANMGPAFAACLHKDFTVMTPWQEREFDGVISQPELVVAQPDLAVTRVQLHPACAQNKVISLGTDLLASRPWRLCRALTAD